MLGGVEQRDDLVDLGFKRGVSMRGEAVATGLDKLGHIGVPEDMGLVRLTRFPVLLQGVDSASFFTALKLDRKGFSTINVHFGLPEPSGNLDFAGRK